MTGGEILFLSHRIPYPPDKGDKIRSWALLKFLASRFRVHLACFVDDPRDFRHKEFLSSICETVALVPLAPRWSRVKSLSALGANKPLTFAYFDSPEMRAAVAAARARPLEMEFAFSSSMAPFIETPIAGRKRIVDFCDADSEKWTEYAASAPPILKQLYAREGRLLATAETRIAEWADLSLAISENETSVFNSRFECTQKVISLPNGVDAQYFDPSQVAPDDAMRSDVVFIGAMDYRANIEGVLRFVDEVWPQVRNIQADARFTIIGANPVSAISALNGKKGIRVTGRVDDIRPWLSGAKIVVAPLNVGRGVQNKVLEAMAMAKPVIASSEAMIGVNAPPAAAVATSDSRAMAQEILSLLNDEKRRTVTGKAARKFVVNNFDWDTSFAKLDAMLADLGLHSSSSPAQSDKASSPTSATR